MHQKSNSNKSTALKRDTTWRRFLACANFVLLTTILCGCNPFGYKDTHPEVPVIDELLKDTTAFAPIRNSMGGMITLLKDDRIWESRSSPNDSMRYKLYDLDGKVYFEYNLPNSSAYYMDTVGNIYMDQKLFPYPDFKPARSIEMIFLEDTLARFRDTLDAHFDSLVTQKEDAYRAELMQRYGLTDCSYEAVHHSECAYIAIDPKRLITFGNPSILNFSKPMQQVQTFDAPCGYSGGGGRLTFGHTTYYYELPNGLRFKSDHEESRYWYVEVPDGLWLHFWEGQYLMKLKN